MDFASRGGDSRNYHGHGEGEQQHGKTSKMRLPSFSLSSKMETVDDQPTNNNEASDTPFVPATDIEKEHMFNKVVTPSDVGKLNRLVIPKQHAEKYFPLDSSTNEKGLLLNFEDRNGKPWRFRYSYWSSSQSYVMTKGWSRFVKEKRLDAGDTVSFGRGVEEGSRDRLFIDWKRRPEVHNQYFNNIQSRHPTSMQNNYTPMMSFSSPVSPWSRFGPISSVYDYNHRNHHNGSGGGGGKGFGYTTTHPYLYFKPSVVGPPHSHHPLPRLGVQMQDSGSGESGGTGYFEFDGRNITVDDGRSRSTIVFDSVPVGHSSIPPSVNSKRFRLFGVNLDCSSSSSSSSSSTFNIVDDHHHSTPAASHLAQLLPPTLSLQLGLGDEATNSADMLYSPTEDKHLSISLDLDI